MRLTFLGTGSAMPTGDRVQSGLLVETSDARLLVDCGSGVLHRLAGTRGGYEDVDAVLLTHLHLDHVADLLPLLKARWLADSDPLEIVGPPGVDDLLDDLLGAFEYLRGRVAYDTREFDLGGSGAGRGTVSVAGLDVDAMRTEHSVTSHAYRFGNALTVSGDTEAFAGLASFADGSAALVHDCSFPDEVDVSNHPTPSQLGAALSGREFGTVYLTHLYPHTRGRHGEMLDSLREHYDGNVQVAKDGLSVEL